MKTVKADYILQGFLFLALTWSGESIPMIPSGPTTLSGNSWVSWECDGEKCIFILGFKTPPSGWIGFGFSDSGNMFNGDMIIWSRDPTTGSYDLLDCYSTGPGSLIVDNVQNYNLLSWNETDGECELVFDRLVDTVDKQDYAITDQSTCLIWAEGPNYTFGSYHLMNRGSVPDTNILQ